MGGARYQRLPVSDHSFLVFEDARTHMHLGGLALFDAAPLTTPHGGVDIARVRAHVASCLHLVPRYRQRLAWVPLVQRPVWVDDAHFNLSYHVRHTALPRPGDDEQLRQLAARIMSQQLDRGKPLWELWVIEGIEGSRMALLAKTHHAVADGISAFNLFAALLSPTPETIVDAPPRWRPRPAPGAWMLLRDEILAQAARPFEVARGLMSALGAPARAAAQVMESVRALSALVRAGFPLPSPTPLNRPIGTHRRFDWLDLDLAQVRAVKARLGGTVNDVVLATVAGALGRFLGGRGVSPRALDYRVVVPVSLRTEDELGTISNRASAWLMSLPIAERDPRRRYALVRAATTQAKASKQALGPDVLGRAAEYAMPGVLALGVRLTAQLHPYNLIVTNVPGPPLPLYLLGARLLAAYPQVPLFESQGLGIALFSYEGALCWGFNADWDLVPDLEDFTRAVADAFRELAAAADESEPVAAAGIAGGRDPDRLSGSLQ